MPAHLLLRIMRWLADAEDWVHLPELRPDPLQLRHRARRVVRQARSGWTGSCQEPVKHAPNHRFQRLRAVSSASGRGRDGEPRCAGRIHHRRVSDAGAGAEGRSGRAGGGPRDGPLSRPRRAGAGRVRACPVGRRAVQSDRQPRAGRFSGVPMDCRSPPSPGPRTLRGRGVPHRREIGAGARPGDLPLPVRLRRRLGGRRTPARLDLPVRSQRSPIRRCWSTSPPMRAACRPRGSRVRSTGIGAPSWRTSIAPITCSPGPIS